MPAPTRSPRNAPANARPNGLLNDDDDVPGTMVASASPPMLVRWWFWPVAPSAMRAAYSLAEIGSGSAVSSTVTEVCAGPAALRCRSSLYRAW